MVVKCETLTHSELKDLLRTNKGAEFIGIKTESNARLKKKDNPFGEVRKISEINGQIRFNYEKAVNKQLEKEGKKPEFEAKSLPWGEAVEGLPMIKHTPKGSDKEKFYLRMRVLATKSPEYTTEDGTVLTKEQVEPFLPKKKSAKSQDLEKEIVIRTYDLASIVLITFRKKTYILVSD